MKHFIEGSRIAVDCETFGLGVWQGEKPFAFSFANVAGETAYFEFIADPFARQPIVEAHSLEMMRLILEDPSIEKVFHNAKFDVRMFEIAYGIKVRGKIDDTLIMAHCCNTLEPSLGLKKLGDKYCGVDDSDQNLLQKNTVKLRRKAKKLGWSIGQEPQPMPNGDVKMKQVVAKDYWMGKTMHHLHPNLATELDATYCETYAVMDVKRTILLDQLYQHLLDELNVRWMYEEMEMKLWSVIYSMETRGPATDTELLRRQMKEACHEMDRLYPEIERCSWSGFRPKNDGDVRKLFYDILGFPVTKMTKGGRNADKQLPAVDKFVILAHLDNPIVRDVAVWKANYTAFGTFFSKFERLSVPDTHGGATALHCDYRQVGPATGRLSSANPNLQNVMTPENTMAVHPIHVRPAFICRPGYVWLCVDYEGMEVRMFAGLSQEPLMMKAILAGRSIHDEMTNTIWGGDNNEDAVNQAMRALSLDGTGIGTSPEVNILWKEWGVDVENLFKLTPSHKFDLAYNWLKSHQFNQVKAQQSIGRKNSKTTIKSLTFLKLYGGGANKASLLLKSTKQYAQQVLNRYDELFPEVSNTFDRWMSEGRHNGYITSLYGRRLAIDPMFSYRACNYMVQGSSADLMKSSMIKTHAWLQSSGVDAHLLLTVHDEIIFEVRKEELTCSLIRKICDLMSDTEGRLPIKMTVEPKVATKNWSVKHKVIY